MCILKKFLEHEKLIIFDKKVQIELCFDEVIKKNKVENDNKTEKKMREKMNRDSGPVRTSRWR